MRRHVLARGSVASNRSATGRSRNSRRYRAARVGGEQVAAASRLREELSASSSAATDFCDVLALSPEVFPGRSGVVDAWAPEGMDPQAWGAEFTEESLEALVATLGGDGDGGGGGNEGGASVPWDVLVNLALWLEEEGGWWWRGEARRRRRRTSRRLALRWHTPRGVAVAAAVARRLATALASASEAARSLAAALPAAKKAVAAVPWASANAAATAAAVRDAAATLGGGRSGVHHDAELRVARNAAFGAAMFSEARGDAAAAADPEAEGERWHAVEWLVATASAVPACAWDVRTAAAAAAELRRVPAAAEAEAVARGAVRAALARDTAALAAALGTGSGVAELREALLRARAAADAAAVVERLRPPEFTELERAATLVQASELRRIVTRAAELRKFRTFSSRGGGGAGGRGAEEVIPDGDGDDDDEEEAAAAAAAEAAAEDLGVIDRVKCTHEYCGRCGAPWLEDGDVAPAATGVCQVDSSREIASHVEGMCCGGDDPHWLSWLTVQTLGEQCDAADGGEAVDFATRYDLRGLLQKF